MARLDVYRLAGSRSTNLVVDVQSSFLSHLDVRVVVPLLPSETNALQAAELNPQFTINGKLVALYPQLLAAVRARELRKPVASLAEHQEEITRALDILLTGF